MMSHINMLHLPSTWSRSVQIEKNVRPNRKNVQPQGLGQLNLAMCPLKMSIPSSVIKHGLLENPPFVVVFSPLRPLFIGDSQSLITRAYIQGTVICLVVWKMSFFPSYRGWWPQLTTIFVRRIKPPNTIRWMGTFSLWIVKTCEKLFLVHKVRPLGKLFHKLVS
jgi:hypothetical protein